MFKILPTSYRVSLGMHASPKIELSAYIASGQSYSPEKLFEAEVMVTTEKELEELTLASYEAGKAVVREQLREVIFGN